MQHGGHGSLPSCVSLGWASCRIGMVDCHVPARPSQPLRSRTIVLRLVSCPSFRPLTEIVFAIGEGHRIVGVSDFDDFPPGVAELPRVGGLMNPSLEAIVAREPDVILTDQSHAAIGSVARLRELGPANRGVFRHHSDDVR